MAGLIAALQAPGGKNILVDARGWDANNISMATRSFSDVLEAKGHSSGEQGPLVVPLQPRFPMWQASCAPCGEMRVVIIAMSHASPIRCLASAQACANAIKQVFKKEYPTASGASLHLSECFNVLYQSLQAMHDGNAVNENALVDINRLNLSSYRSAIPADGLSPDNHCVATLEEDSYEPEQHSVDIPVFAHSRMEEHGDAHGSWEGDGAPQVAQGTRPRSDPFHMDEENTDSSWAFSRDEGDARFGSDKPTDLLGDLLEAPTGAPNAENDDSDAGAHSTHNRGSVVDWIDPFAENDDTLFQEEAEREFSPDGRRASTHDDNFDGGAGGSTARSSNSLEGVNSNDNGMPNIPMQATNARESRISPRRSEEWGQFNQPFHFGEESGQQEGFEERNRRGSEVGSFNGNLEVNEDDKAEEDICLYGTSGSLDHNLFPAERVNEANEEGDLEHPSSPFAFGQDYSAIPGQRTASAVGANLSALNAEGYPFEKEIVRQREHTWSVVGQESGSGIPRESVGDCGSAEYQGRHDTPYPPFQEEGTSYDAGSVAFQRPDTANPEPTSGTSKQEELNVEGMGQGLFTDGNDKVGRENFGFSMPVFDADDNPPGVQRAFHSMSENPINGNGTRETAANAGTTRNDQSDAEALNTGDGNAVDASQHVPNESESFLNAAPKSILSDDTAREGGVTQSHAYLGSVSSYTDDNADPSAFDPPPRFRDAEEQDQDGQNEANEPFTQRDDHLSRDNDQQSASPADLTGNKESAGPTLPAYKGDGMFEERSGEMHSERDEGTVGIEQDKDDFFANSLFDAGDGLDSEGNDRHGGSTANPIGHEQAQQEHPGMDDTKAIPVVANKRDNNVEQGQRVPAELIGAVESIPDEAHGPLVEEGNGKAQVNKEEPETASGSPAQNAFAEGLSHERGGDAWVHEKFSITVLGRRVANASVQGNLSAQRRTTLRLSALPQWNVSFVAHRDKVEEAQSGATYLQHNYCLFFSYSWQMMMMMMMTSQKGKWDR